MMFTVLAVTGGAAATILKAGVAWKIAALLTFVVGVLTFPADPTTQGAASRGSGFLYFGPYTASGNDTTITANLGPTTGGIELDTKRTLAEISCDQYLNPIGAFPSAESWELKTAFVHDHLQLHYQAWTTLGAESTPANVLVGGTLGSLAGSLTIGESTGRRYVQLVWRGPGPGDTVTRTVQFWRAFPMPGNWKFEKGKERTMVVSWKILSDPSAGQNSKGYVGLKTDA